VTETSFLSSRKHTKPERLLYTSDQNVVQAAIFTTQRKTQETNIHAINSIQTYDFRNQAVATYTFDSMTTLIAWGCIYLI